MAKILAPNKQYTGTSASVGFVNGVGETTKTALIKWFKDHGYEVEEEEAEAGLQVPPIDDNSKELKDMTVEELTAYAQEKGIDLGNATTQAGILKKIQDVAIAE